MQKSEKVRKNVDSEALCAAAVKGLLELKGRDIISLDLRNTKNTTADFFVIASGTSDTHTEALMTSAEGVIYKETGELPWHTEGKINREWILMDYVNVVIHVFQKKHRSFYGLEELWGDADIKSYGEENILPLK